jgi:hypothetical protein
LSFLWNELATCFPKENDTLVCQHDEVLLIVHRLLKVEWVFGEKNKGSPLDSTLRNIKVRVDSNGETAFSWELLLSQVFEWKREKRQTERKILSGRVLKNVDSKSRLATYPFPNVNQCLKVLNYGYCNLSCLQLCQKTHTKTASGN